MPKRQKAKVRPTSAPIDKKPSAKRVANKLAQGLREDKNKELKAQRIKTPWAVAKDIRRNKRRNAGLHAAWRRKNGSTVDSNVHM